MNKFIPPLKHDLRGSELLKITKDSQPVYPCWCYHQGFGFSWFDKEPAYELGEHCSNIVGWLRLNPNIDQ